MNVIAAAQAHNRKALQQNWHHFCDPTLSFSMPRYGQLLSIWQAKAGSRKMPSRADMTARDLKDFLRNILLCQREATNPSRYRWRLAGNSVTEVLGNHTGKTFEESIPPDHLERWVETSDLILNSEQPWRIRGRVHLQGRDYLEAESLYLPLANDNNEPSYILGLCRYTSRAVSEADNSWENELASLPGGLF